MPEPVIDTEYPTDLQQQSALFIVIDIRKTGGLKNTPVFDKNKVRLERQKIHMDILKDNLNESTLLQSLYFDDRIDKTFFIETSENAMKHRQGSQEDHLSLIQEPGSKYLGHFKPLSGKALVIAVSTFKFMFEKWKNYKVIRTIENQLGIPLQ